MEIKQVTYSRYSDVNGFYENFEQVVGIGYLNSKYMLSRHYKRGFLSMDAATKTKDMRWLCKFETITHSQESLLSMENDTTSKDLGLAQMAA